MQPTESPMRPGLVAVLVVAGGAAGFLLGRLTAESGSQGTELRRTEQSAPQRHEAPELRGAPDGELGVPAAASARATQPAPWRKGDDPMKEVLRVMRSLGHFEKMPEVDLPVRAEGWRILVAFEGVDVVGLLDAVLDRLAAGGMRHLDDETFEALVFFLQGPALKGLVQAEPETVRRWLRSLVELHARYEGEGGPPDVALDGVETSVINGVEVLLGAAVDELPLEEARALVERADLPVGTACVLAGHVGLEGVSAETAERLLTGILAAQHGGHWMALVGDLAPQLDSVADMDRLVVAAAVDGPIATATPSIWLMPWLRATDRLSWPQARPLIEAGLATAPRPFGHLVLEMARIDAGMRAWAIDEPTVPEPVRDALRRQRDGGPR